MTIAAVALVVAGKCCSQIIHE